VFAAATFYEHNMMANSCSIFAVNLAIFYNAWNAFFLLFNRDFRIGLVI